MPLLLLYDFLRLEPLGEFVDAHAVLHAHITHSGAPEREQMGTAAKRLAYVAGQGADVGSLATDDSHSHLHGVGVEVEQLQTVYHQHLGLQVDLLALACQVVGPVPVDLACREGWAL